MDKKTALKTGPDQPVEENNSSEAQSRDIFKPIE